MAALRAEMWRAYLFQDVEVRLIQQWQDPYGRPMVRIETINEDESRAESMLEDIFLAGASPIAADG